MHCIQWVKCTDQHASESMDAIHEWEPHSSKQTEQSVVKLFYCCSASACHMLKLFYTFLLLTANDCNVRTFSASQLSSCMSAMNLNQKAEITFSFFLSASHSQSAAGETHFRSSSSSSIQYSAVQSIEYREACFTSCYSPPSYSTHTLG